MVFVEPQVLRRGVGATLVDSAVEALRRRGDTAVTAWMRDTNTGALGVARSRGFSHTGRTDALPQGEKMLQLTRRL